ncbi:MAG: hypothetical protein ACK5NN_04185 [Sphingomonadaceae bacterium]
MRKLIAPFLAGAALAPLFLLAAAMPAAAQQSRTEQDRARQEMQAGNQLSLREIERRVLPSMKNAEYLGPAYDSTVKAYRLKFIRQGKVLFVDVDARSGRVIRRSF